MSDALDARLEAGIAILAVLVFIGILLAAASMGAIPPSEFGATSAYAVVGAIVAFILLMAGVGYWLSGKQE